MNLLKTNLARLARIRAFVLATCLFVGVATAAAPVPGAPHLTASTNNSYAVGAAATVVNSSVTLTAHPSVVFSAGKVSIGAGYDASDELLYTQVHSITGYYDPSTGVLYLSGAGTAAEYQDAFRSVMFRNNDTGITATTSRTINFSIGEALYNEHNGHYYELIEDYDSPSWSMAKSYAEGRTYFGLQGYLVTVTSGDENTFLAQKINSDTWIGASDAHTEGIWRWVTGPEGLQNGGLGLKFSDQFLTGGIGGCSADQAPGVNGEYANWASGEPNDCGGDEDVAHFIGGNAEWNDYPDYDGMVSYYLVEYGGMPGDPTIQVADNMVLTVNGASSNAAPVVSGPISLPADNEDIASTTIISVSDLLNGNATDANGDALGLAVYGMSGNGQWQQSVDGNTWYGFDYSSPAAAPLSSTNAKLLAPSMQIRFVPNADWNGTAQFSYKAWDQTSGSNLAFVDLTTSGGTTAYSGNTGTVSQVINAINDEPTVILPNTAGVLNFGGGSEYVDLPDLNIAGPNMTVEAWVYIDNVNKNWARIIDFGNGSANNNILFGFEGNTGRLFTEVYNGSSSIKLSAPSVFPANQWVHVAAVWNGNTATIYQNGVAVASGPQLSISNVTRVNNYLGKSNWADEYLDGKMTDIRIWSTARTQTEIANNSNTILQGNESGLMLYYKASEPASTYLADYGPLNKWGTFHNTNWLTVQVPVASLSTKRDSSLSIGNIQFGDIDAASGNVTATFTVSNGTLTAITSGSVLGSGTASMQVTGTVAQLSADFLANGLIYTPANGWDGTDRLDVSINDQGNTGSGGALSNSASIIINVIPNMNSAPVMANQTMSIAENSANATLVGTIAATDADGNALIFSLVSQSVPGVFAVAANGQITVANSAALDYEALSTVTLTVQVSDGTETVSATITIHISNVNEAPVIADASFTIDEDHSLDVLPTIYGAYPSYLIDVDGDTMQNIMFPSLPSHGTLFASGVPVVAGQPYGRVQIIYTPAQDYNGGDSFTFNIGDGQLYASAPATVFVSVLSVNDIPTLQDVASTTREDVSFHPFSGATASIFNDVETAQPLFIKIISLPSQGTLTLSTATVTAGDEIAFADFANLVYTPAADYNGTDSFTWNATDGDNYASNHATATLTILPVNDGPVDITSATTSVDENAAVGTIVTTFSTTDIDAGDSHYYQLVSGVDPLDNHFFYIAGNQLFVANEINFEQRNKLSIRIQTVDQGGLTFEKVFVLNVNDKNDAPIELTLTNNIVDEQQGVGTFVGILLTDDEDANDSHTLTLVNGAGDVDNASFAIVNNVLVTNAVLDYYTQQRYSVRVRSTDAAGEMVEEVFVIHLQDINQAPTAIAISNATIAENNAIGRLVGYFNSTDIDANDTHTYTLVSGAGDDDNASFTISNGDLNAAEVFDFESKTIYKVRIRSTDAAGAFIEEVFVISILDASDAPTGIAITATSIDENQTIGTLVGNFSTIDPDQLGGHDYSLVGGVGCDDNGSFFISGNKLYSSIQFNYEVKNSYTVRVRSIDDANNYTEEVFVIAVNDLNDTPTDVTVNVIGVSENASIGTTAGFINATDEDFISRHTFTLVPGFGATDNGKFSINVNKLEVNTLLDYEQQSSYTVRLRATDDAGAFVEKHLVISINDVNEVPTVLALSATTIDENEPAGAIIGTFSSIDQDLGDNHNYSFATGAGDDDNASFYISGDMLMANASFNYEAKSSYTIRVSTKDLGGLTLEEVFSISITNKIDAPVMANITKVIYRNTPHPFTPREFVHSFSQEEGKTLKYIKITALPTRGDLLFMNTPVVVGQTFLVAELSSLSYSPMLGYVGPDNYKFTAYDGVSFSSDATYSLNIIANRQIGAAVTHLQVNNSIRTLGGFANRESGAVGVEKEMPLELSAFSNYPNPFNGATNITFELPANMQVTLEVYDLLGRKVATLIEGEELSGKQAIQWNGHEAGNYICRIVATSANGEVVTKTISLLQVK